MAGSSKVSADITMTQDSSILDDDIMIEDAFHPAPNIEQRNPSLKVLGKRKARRDKERDRSASVINLDSEGENHKEPHELAESFRNSVRIKSHVCAIFFR